jgi:hypothetical protein
MFKVGGNNIWSELLLWVGNICAFIGFLSGNI